REAWKVAGFDLRRNTWRLEFSMSGDSHGYECGGMKRKFSDMDFDSLGVKQMVAEMLIQKYFTFAYKRGTGRKRLPLIQATNLVGFEKVRIYETDETRSSRIFAKHLFKHIQKLHEEDGLLPVTELQAYVEYINYKGM